MTLIVGIYSNDGVVIGADTGLTTEARGCDNKPMGLNSASKIEILNDQIIVACAGSVGLGQRFAEIVRRHAGAGRFVGSRPHDLANTLSAEANSNFATTPMEKYPVGAVMAFPSENQHRLCEFAFGSLQPEFKTNEMWFHVEGTCPDISAVFLFYLRQIVWPTTGPNLEDGKLAALWTLGLAQRIFGGDIREPFELAVLERDPADYRARKLAHEEVAMLRGRVVRLEKQIGSYLARILGRRE